MDNSAGRARFFELAIEYMAGICTAPEPIRILGFGSGSRRIAKELTNLGYESAGATRVSRACQKSRRVFA
jgi:hypothetical protein